MTFLKKYGLFILAGIGLYWLFLRQPSKAGNQANGSTNTAGVPNTASGWLSYLGLTAGQPANVNQTGSILTGVGSVVNGLTGPLKSIGSWFAGGNTATPNTPVSSGIPVNFQQVGGGYDPVISTDLSADVGADYNWNGGPDSFGFGY